MCPNYLFLKRFVGDFSRAHSLSALGSQARTALSSAPSAPRMPYKPLQQGTSPTDVGLHLKSSHTRGRGQNRAGLAPQRGQRACVGKISHKFYFLILESNVYSSK